MDDDTAVDLEKSKTKTVEGIVYFNLEQSDFRPLDIEEVWWIDMSGSGELSHTLVDAFHTFVKNEPLSDQMFLIYAKVEALISTAGIHGHRGTYQRRMKILRVVEVRRAKPREIAQRKKLESQQ
jgi:hypothetical protein